LRLLRAEAGKTECDIIVYEVLDHQILAADLIAIRLLIGLENLCKRGAETDASLGLDSVIFESDRFNLNDVAGLVNDEGILAALFIVDPSSERHSILLTAANAGNSGTTGAAGTHRPHSARPTRTHRTATLPTARTHRAHRAGARIIWTLTLEDGIAKTEWIAYISARRREARHTPTFSAWGALTHPAG